MAERVKLTEAELSKLRWANKFPQVKIDDFDTVGDNLTDRGYLKPYDAGYVDWYGYWVEITDAGRSALASQENDRG